MIFITSATNMPKDEWTWGAKTSAAKLADELKKTNDPSKSTLMGVTPYGRPPLYAPTVPRPGPLT